MRKRPTTNGRKLRLLLAWLLAGLLVGTPGGAAAQDARLAELRESLPAEAVTRIQEIATRARAQGVPEGPLLDKALEGAAKHVPPDRIVAALDAYAERLGRAGDLLGPERTAGELVAGADALRRGVPGPTIRELATTRVGDIAVPLVVLGDLVGLGVPAEGAYETVEQALGRGSMPHQILAIPAVVQGLVREGRPPADAANEISGMFARGVLPVGIPGPVPPGLRPPVGAPVPPGAGGPEGAGKEKEGPPVEPPGGRI